MIPRSEHPRPQFVRDAWTNLNGKWAFEIDSVNTGVDRAMFSTDYKLNSEIIVPFCPESELSGVGHKEFMLAVWYKKTISITAEQLAGRVIANFGAVDYEATIYVNGEKVGTHAGGYISFSMDITKFLKVGDNELCVRAFDDTRSGKQPRGKQSSLFYSHSCDYTRTTGIWQTVWLEYVPNTYLKSVKTYADASGSISFNAVFVGDTKGYTLRTVVSKDGAAVAERTVAAANCGVSYEIVVENPVLWDVGAPNLYDITYTLIDACGNAVDTVKAYTGFRTVEIRGKAICLNGRPVFQRLILDQGFYPDGIYTAPTDEALKNDIVLCMEAGFNGARLHQKIFEERFLYHADCLGYLVWGEHANWGLDITTLEGLANFMPEWTEEVERDYNHPSLIGWCPFNETVRNQDDRVIDIVYKTTKLLDSTRPVIDTSGYVHVNTDVYDIHHYEQDPVKFAEYYGGEKFFDPYNPRRTHCDEPFFVSEYGGTWWVPELVNSDQGEDNSQNRKISWGYGNAPATEEEVCYRICGLTKVIMDNPNICALCYTQLTNVEQEQNGIYTYDRKRKFSDETYAKIRATLTAKAAIEE